MAQRGRPKKTQTAPKIAKEPKETKEPEVKRIVCIRCGNSTQSNFYVTKDSSHKYFGKLPYCKTCVKAIYDGYLLKYHDMNLAVYYTCRKIDIAYIHNNYLGALETINNPDSKIQGEDAIISAYMKCNAFADINGHGLNFDGSAGENRIEKLTSFDDVTKIKRDLLNKSISEGNSDEQYEIIEYDTKVLMSKWGSFDNESLSYLESEYLDWEEKLGGIEDKTTDILVKQICYQCLEIYIGRQGDDDVSKKIAMLQTLLNNTGLLSKQNDASKKKQSGVGMRIADVEFHKPIPTETPVFDDVDGMKNYIYGAAGCFFKATGVENEYTKFFDDWMEEYSIDTIADLVENRKREEAIALKNTAIEVGDVQDE